MTAAEHPIAPEEVMAWRDGALTPERAATVEAHVARCGSCRQLGDQLDEVSRDLERWHIEEAPGTLRAPQASTPVRVSQWPGLFAWRRTPVVWQFAGVGVMIMLVAVVTVSRSTKPIANKATAATPAAAQLPSAAPRAFTFGGQSGVRPEARQGRGVGGGEQAQPPGDTAVLPRSMIARTATLKIVAADFDLVRPAVDRILGEVSGFVGRVDVSGERGTARSLNATLRVPGDRLDAALGALRRLGQVIAESQGGDEVTEQVVDLEVRLSNARNAEKRLTEVLLRRTGDVADVLAVEREIARVRGEIERFDAERKNLERRVSYATVTLEIVEERKAALDLGPLPISVRLRNALVDGSRSAAESALDATLFAMRVGPVLLLWSAILAWPLLVFVRRYRGSRPS